MLELVPIAVVVAGGFLVYKAFTYARPTKAARTEPVYNYQFGDDKLTYAQGQHSDNRLEPIAHVRVADRVHFASVNGALFEVNPQELNPEPNYTAYQVDSHW